MDLSYAMQHCFEEVFFHLLNELHGRVPEEISRWRVAAHSIALRTESCFFETPFRRTWIQPAAGDEGLAIGAALHTYHSVLKQPRRQQLNHAYLGRSFLRRRSPQT